MRRVVMLVRPNEQDLICRAAAWRIRSVELSRCVQASAVWGLQGVAAGSRGGERQPGRGETDPARAAWAGMSVDWVLATMAERAIGVNAGRRVAGASRVRRCVLDVRGVTAEVAFMADVRDTGAAVRACRSSAACRSGRRGSGGCRSRARAGRRSRRTLEGKELGRRR